MPQSHFSKHIVDIEGTSYTHLEHGEVTSTNNMLKYMALDACQSIDRVILSAASQTEGRGKSARPWISPQGNLYASFGLSFKQQRQQLTQVPFIVAVALRRAIASILPDGTAVSCKWPNDIVVNNHKIAGILVEAVHAFNHMHLIVGIGVNIANYPNDDSVSMPATCIHECGGDTISPRELLKLFTHEFHQVMNQWQQRELVDALRQEWTEHAWRLNKNVTIGQHNGTLVGLEALGQAILQMDDGSKHYVTTGDMQSTLDSLTPADEVLTCS